MTDETQAAEMATTEEVVTEEQVQQHEPETPETEAAEATEVVAETEAEAPEADKPKRETAAERRERDRQYKARLKEEADAARKDADAAEAKRKRILEAGQHDKAPIEKDFDDYNEYVATLAVWKHSQQAAKREAEHASSEVEQARQREQAARAKEREALHRDWQAQTAEAKSRYADFDAVVSAPDLFPQGSHLPDLILTAENAADLAYAVARDRALHDRLLSLSPVEASRELGRIEARLSAPKPRLETNAPQPITPVRPKATAAADPAKMSPAEYAKWREAGGTFKL